MFLGCSDQLFLNHHGKLQVMGTDYCIDVDYADDVILEDCELVSKGIVIGKIQFIFYLCKICSVVSLIPYL